MCMCEIIRRKILFTKNASQSQMVRFYLDNCRAFYITWHFSAPSVVW